MLSVLLLLSFPAPQNPTPEEFDSALKEARTLSERDRWKEAQEKLLEILNFHGPVDYVLRKREELLDFDRQCAWWKDHQPVLPREVVSGELLNYSNTTGLIKIRYTPGRMGDFDAPEQQDARIHPAVFAGDYTVELRGHGIPDPEKPFFALACYDGTDGSFYGFLLADGGERWRTGVYRYDGKNFRRLQDVPQPTWKAERTFSLVMKVTDTRITISFNGVKHAQTDKPRDLYGQFLHLNTSSVAEEILISGKVNPSWIEGLVSAEENRRRENFYAKYQPDHLPEWLRPAEKPPAEEQTTGGGTAEKEEDVEPIPVPGAAMPGQETHVGKVSRWLHYGKLDKAIDYLGKLAPASISQPARDYLLAVAWHDSGDLGKALEHCKRALAAEPGFLDSRVLRGWLHFESLERDAARSAFETLVKEFPDQAGGYQALARFLLLEGRLPESKALVEEGISKCKDAQPLRDFNLVLARAQRGPDWKEPFAHETEHYQVSSNITLKTCQDAGKTLEQAWRYYQRVLPAAPELGARKFRVFLFKGQEDYISYIESVEHPGGEYSNGLYSLLLKQLLIWNVPDRDEMMKVVRHEGFHQYLDQLTSYAPRWFHEGLAEYFELAEWQGGQWQAGQPHRGHLLFMEDAKLVPLHDLIFDHGSLFARNMPLAYAQSWGFFHFLLHSNDANRKLFERLFQGVVSGGGGAENLEEIFAGFDWKKFNREYLDHLTALYREL